MNMRAVARHAGVSSATVSRVINGVGCVREETAQRVRQALEELNFVPNPVATTLKYGRSRTYGLIVPDLMNPFFCEVLREFESALVDNDQELLLACTESIESKLIGSVRRMLMRHVEGVVLLGSEFDTRAIEPLFKRRIPVVTVDRRRVQVGSSDVAIDFESGYRQAVQHLKELGHRRIGFIGGSNGIVTSQIRHGAFRQAMQAAGLTYDERLVRSGDYRIPGGIAGIRSLLKEPRRPTAVITANDLTAFGVMRGLHTSGIRVPDKMSVVGFDGIALSDAVNLSLTTIQISTREMVQACFKALDHTKANLTKRGLEISIRGSLVVRDSTGIARTRQRA